MPPRPVAGDLKFYFLVVAVIVDWDGLPVCCDFY